MLSHSLSLFCLRIEVAISKSWLASYSLAHFFARETWPLLSQPRLNIRIQVLHGLTADRSVLNPSVHPGQCVGSMTPWFQRWRTSWTICCSWVFQHDYPAPQMLLNSPNSQADHKIITPIEASDPVLITSKDCNHESIQWKQPSPKRQKTLLPLKASACE